MTSIFYEKKTLISYHYPLIATCSSELTLNYKSITKSQRSPHTIGLLSQLETLLTKLPRIEFQVVSINMNQVSRVHSQEQSLEIQVS